MVLVVVWLSLVSMMILILFVCRRWIVLGVEILIGLVMLMSLVVWLLRVMNMMVLFFWCRFLVCVLRLVGLILSCFSSFRLFSVMWCLLM